MGLVVGGGVNNVATDWTTAPMDVESFVLVRIDHGLANVDNAYMWINPDLSAEPSLDSAMANATGNFSFNRLRPFAGNPSTASGNIAATGSFDEIRIGQTWSDVTLTPVPEPSVTALCILGGLGLAWRMFRRR